MKILETLLILMMAVVVVIGVDVLSPSPPPPSADGGVTSLVVVTLCVEVQNIDGSNSQRYKATLARGDAHIITSPTPSRARMVVCPSSTTREELKRIQFPPWSGR